MANNFCWRVLVKFRHRVVLAIFCGYFATYFRKASFWIQWHILHSLVVILAYTVFLSNRVWWWNLWKEVWTRRHQASQNLFSTFQKERFSSNGKIESKCITISKSTSKNCQNPDKTSIFYQERTFRNATYHGTTYGNTTFRNQRRTFRVWVCNPWNLKKLLNTR